MVWWATLLLFQLQPLDIPDKNPQSSAADIEQGKRLFMGRCAGCHGPTGDGGKGANLAVPRLSRANDDRGLYRIVRFGIPDTEMPATLMDTHEVWQVAAFVKSLGRMDSGPAKGDARAGEKIFRGSGGCLACHAMGTEGGRTGPALTGIGARRSAKHLRNKILDPASDLPDNLRVVQVTTKEGKSISGTRLNEDTYSIQLRDPMGNLHSFWKEGIVKFASEKKSMMPAYRGRLTDGQSDDLVAFLSSQRGDQ